MTKQPSGLDLDSTQFDRINPDIDALKYILENRNSKTDTRLISAIHQKIAAMSITPTIIEKTMTQQQLFDLGHPLWALPYTIYEIKHYLSNYNECTCYEDVEVLTQSYRKIKKYLENTPYDITW